MSVEYLGEIVKKTVVFLFVSYLPVLITLVLAWIVVSQLYFKNRKTDDAQRRKSSTTTVDGKATDKTDHSVSRHTSSTTTSTSSSLKVGTGQSAVAKKTKQHQDKWSYHHRDSKQNFSHEWLLTSLKGHTGTIQDMDFSANGKYLATCANDRAVFVWSTKDWNGKNHKYIRYNLDFDYARCLRFSPDSKAFVLVRSDNSTSVCRLKKKNDGWIAAVEHALTYESKGHSEDIVSLGIAPNGKFIMTCDTTEDLLLRDVKSGDELTRISTLLITLYAAKVSPCGKFVAASGFAPDVKIWEVFFTKNGEFKQMSRAFELTGHSSGVLDFAFNVDSTRMATISKDGFWRLFDIKIEFTQGEVPRLLQKGKFKIDNDTEKAFVALSPDGNVIAWACASTLAFVNGLNGQTDKIINGIYPGGKITRLLFDAAGDYILTAGDRHVRIFHNVTARKVNAQLYRDKLKTSGLSSATKERLEQSLAACEEFLCGFK